MSKAMEKEIAAVNKNGIKERYRMYLNALLQLAEKTESREKKGDKK